MAVALIICSTTFSNRTWAQDNTGTEFYFTVFAEGFINHLPGVYVVGNYDATVTIDYVARNPANDQAGDPQCTRYTFNLVGGVPQYVDIPYDAQALCFRYYDRFNQIETVQKNGIKVTSTAPIALYSQFLATASSEMTPILPITEMGQDYIITAYREITNTDNNFNARTTIVGMQSNTQVTITLPNYTWTSRDANGGMKRGPGSTWTITLNEGETYTFLSNDNGQGLNATPTGSTVIVNHNQGLNGVRVTSDKPISVLSGTDCTWIGNDEYIGCGACDLTCTHLKPLNRWGSNYVTTQTLIRPNQMSAIANLRNPNPPNIEPFPANNNSRSVSDYLLITAQTNGTVVSIDGIATYSKTLNAGEWFIYESPGISNPSTPPPTTNQGATHHKITSNNPIQVIQMMKGWQCDNVNPADPTQMLVVEEAKWDDNYIVTNPSQYVNNFFAFLIYEPNGNSDARNTLVLNVGGSNVPIPSGVSPSGDGNGGWTAIGTTGYWFQRLTINGASAIKARSVPASPNAPTYPFAFYASGSTNASSYGYMGGAVCQLEAFTSASLDSVCETSPITLSLDSTQNGGTVATVLNYTYQWDVYDAQSNNVYTFSGAGPSANHTFNAVGSGQMTAVLSLTDNAGCFTRDSVQFYVAGLPVIDDIADFSACGSTTLPAITGTNLTGNQAFYTATNGGGTQYLPGSMISTSGTYYMFDESFTNCSDEESVAITINSSPMVDPATITTACDGSGTNFTLSFTVSGGTGGPYTVTEVAPGGTGGSFSGNTYTTNNMASGTTYNFEVTDANNCPAVVVQGTRNCNCIGDAGTMATTNLTECGNGAQTASAGTVAPTLDANDVESFVLHDNSGGTLGAVLDENTTPTFAFNPGTMTYGTQYYISRVVGDDKGGGLVDLLDACLSVSVGQPTLWNEEVTMTFTANSPICEGTSGSLDFAINGPGPFSMIYDNGSGNQNILNASNNHSEAVNPTQTTTYTMVSVTSNANGCSADFSGGAPSLTIDVHTTPIANNIQEICQPDFANYIVSFDVANGQAPYTVTVNSPGGVTGSFNGNTWTSTNITSGTSYNFTLNDVNGCGSTTISGVNSCICLSDAGGMDPTLREVCGDQVITATPDISQVPYLDDNDVLGYVLHDNSGNSLGVVYDQSTNSSFNFNPALMTWGVTYYISQVVGNNDGTGNVDLNDVCLDVSFGTPVIWHQQPIAAATANDPLCSGDVLQLNGSTTNNVTSASYAWAGNGGWMSNDQNPVVSNVPASLNGPITLTVTNNMCTDDVTLNVQIDQTADAQFDAVLLNSINEPHHYQFNNNSTGAGSYMWYFGDGDSSDFSDPDHLYDILVGEAPVTLYAFGQNGCDDSITIYVNLLVVPQNDTVLVFMPNSFTPDGNEFNQYLNPVFNESVDPNNYSMEVYNRWGEKVFQTHDLNVGWDGAYQDMASPSGSYAWKVEFTDKYTFKRYKYEGHVILIR